MCLVRYESGVEMWVSFEEMHKYGEGGSGRIGMCEIEGMKVFTEDGVAMK